MPINAGSRLKSAVCDTQVVVVRAPASDVDLTCGGVPMLALDAEPVAGAVLDPAHAEGTLLGKRYASDEIGIELLCTKAGQGSLWLNGQPLGLKQAKALPSSD